MRKIRETYVKELTNRGVEILWNTNVRKIVGNSKVREIALYNNETGEERKLPIDGVFIFVGEKPNSEFAKESGVKVNEKGYIIVDTLQKTNINGVYAAGDVTTCPVKQIGTAIGQAIIASTEAYKYVKKPYYA